MEQGGAERRRTRTESQECRCERTRRREKRARTAKSWPEGRIRNPGEILAESWQGPAREKMKRTAKSWRDPGEILARTRRKGNELQKPGEISPLV